MGTVINSRIRHYERCRKLFKYLDDEVYDVGRDLFLTDAALAEWLCDPARALGYKVPIRVMRTVKGRRQVLEVLMGIAHGNVL
jgi:uncharacterized protein (DUF2384 family)